MHQLGSPLGLRQIEAVDLCAAVPAGEVLAVEYQEDVARHRSAGVPSYSGVGVCGGYHTSMRRPCLSTLRMLLGKVPMT